MAEDQEAVLRAAEAWGVKQLPQGPNWLALPDGLNVEILQATSGTVAAALAVNPRVQQGKRRCQKNSTGMKPRLVTSASAQR
jgi:hypothetical protein